jgi:membrane-bound serine protease (ClpP class)
MESLLQIDPATISADVIYLALLIGLWLGVTAFYMPGTGIIEMFALIAIAGVFVVMSALPTNWVAVSAMVLGVTGFLILPFLRPHMAQYAELGLLLQAGGGFFLLNGQTVSLALIAVTVALAWLYNRYVLIPMLQTRRTGLAYDDDKLIGNVGYVVAALNPKGTVQVNGELWTARSDEPLEKDVSVVVLEKRGLELIVEKAKRENRNGVRVESDG